MTRPHELVPGERSDAGSETEEYQTVSAVNAYFKSAYIGALLTRYVTGKQGQAVRHTAYTGQGKREEAALRRYGWDWQ